MICFLVVTAIVGLFVSAGIFIFTAPKEPDDDDDSIDYDDYDRDYDDYDR